MNKYNNKKTQVDMYVFDSALEAKRYKQLALLEKANKINNLKLQPRFLLYAIKQWFKDHVPYMVMVVIVSIIAFLVYGQADRDIKAVQERENRINTIEERLTKQEHYMHQVQADVDNLYRVVE